MTTSIIAKNVSQASGSFMIGQRVVAIDSNSSSQESPPLGGHGFLFAYEPPVGKVALVELNILYETFLTNTFMQVDLQDNDAGALMLVSKRFSADGDGQLDSVRFQMFNDMVIGVDGTGVNNDGIMDILARITEIPIQS